MKTKKLFFASIILSVLLLNACKKSSSDNPSPSGTDTKTVLTSHAWLIASSGALVDGKSYAEKASSTQDLSETTFKADGTLAIYDPDTKSTDTGKWLLSGTTLTLTQNDPDFGTITVPFTISQLTSSAFTLAWPEIDLTKVDPNKDISTIKSTDKDYLAYLEIFAFGFTDYVGLTDDLRDNAKKIQLLTTFKAK